MTREKRPIERLRLWEHDRDVTELFEIEEHEFDYRISGPIELFTSMTVLEDTSRARTNIDRAGNTEAVRRARESHGEEIFLSVPKWYWKAT